MQNFIYRCPVTNLNVQGSMEKAAADGKEYVPLRCLACGLVHMVSPKTGILMFEKRPPRKAR